MDNKTLFKKLSKFQLEHAFKTFCFLIFIWNMKITVDYEKHPYLIEKHVRVMSMMSFILVLLPTLVFLIHNHFSLNEFNVLVAIQVLILWILSIAFSSIPCLIYLYLTHKKKV